MTVPPINLTHLRDQTGFGDHRICITRDELLALIDTAEAADLYVNWHEPRSARKEMPYTKGKALTRLRETLTRYTTD